jgi:Flp pilus assembly pilin Flp
MSHISGIVRSFKRLALRYAQRKGQTLVEYALILAIISVVAIGAMINLGQGVKGIYSSINSTISSSIASH